MPKLTFYPFDIGYREVEGKPQVCLYGRTAAGQVCVADENFSPYFFVSSRSASNARELIEGLDKSAREKITKIETVKKRWLGREVEALKLTASLPSDIALIQEEARKAGLDTFEADIPLTRRYLIDKKITPLTLCEAEGEIIGQGGRIETIKAGRVEQLSDDTVEPRVLAFDIETYYDASKSFNAITDSPILMIAFAGNNFRKVITWKRFDTELDYIEFVGSELELIERFKQVIQDYKPDIIIGYFSDRFDLPYLSQRAKKYKVKLDLGLDNSQIEFKAGNANTAQITGIVHLDLFKFIRRTVGLTMNFSNYDLDSVARELLGEEKIGIDFGEMTKIWDNNLPEIEEFCKYNLRDAELTLRLAEKLMPNLYEMVKIVGLPPYDVSRMSFSQIVEWYLIKRVQEFNELVPPRPGYHELSQRTYQTYAGAYVYEPVPGLYSNIAVFDFRSLYPTIIAAHNISPDTLNCRCCAAEAELTPEEKGSKNWFCRKRKGFIATVIEDLIRRRMRIKEIMRKGAEKDIMLEARQLVLKTIANAMYGYLGFAAARWYSIECARAITAYERNYITTVIENAKKVGFNVIYSDTDSIFMALEEKTEKDVIEFIEGINLELPGLMELEYEGLYPAGIFVSTKAKGEGAKKRYALVSKKGEIKIRGFETVRRNLSPIAKEAQLEVLKIVLREGDKQKALGYVQEIINGIKDRRFPVEKMIITTQLTKDIKHYDAVGPHVAAAQRMRDRGVEVSGGTMVSYVIVPGDQKIIRERVRLPEEVGEGEYDPDYYINNQVVPAVEKIFEVLGYEKGEIMGGKKQSRLSSYFG